LVTHRFWYVTQCRSFTNLWTFHYNTRSQIASLFTDGNMLHIPVRSQCSSRFNAPFVHIPINVTL